MDIVSLDDNEIKSISKKMNKIRENMNPYATNIDVGGDERMLFMFVPMYRDYLCKLVVTAMIGYLNRACDEWGVPDSVPVVPVYDYIKEESLLDDPKQYGDIPVSKDLLDNYLINRKLMKKRIIIKEFLEQMFQYDPDEHIRSAYTPNLNDPERKIIVNPTSRMALYMENKRLKNDKKASSKKKKRGKKVT